MSLLRCQKGNGWLMREQHVLELNPVTVRLAREPLGLAALAAMALSPNSRYYPYGLRLNPLAIRRNATVDR